MSLCQNVSQLGFIFSGQYFTPFELLQCMLYITNFYDLKRKTIDFKDIGLKINVRS